MNEEKRLVPKLRFPEFREAEGWESATLEEVAEFVRERIPVEQVELANYISTENILPDYSGVTRASKLPSTGSVTRFRPNDTLVSNIRPYLKKVWFANKNGGSSNDVIVIRAKSKLVTQYFPFLLKNDSFIDYVMTGAKGVKMPRGDVSSMKEYPAFYPTHPEQQKIADCLGSVDDLIAAQARKVDALKTHKKGLMQQLFPREGETQPRLRFPEFQNAGEWEEKPLDEIFAFRQGLQVAVDQQFLNGGEGRKRFIRIIDVTQNNEPLRYIEIADDLHVLSKEDIFMIRYGTPGIVSIGYEGVIANNLFQLIFKVVKNNSPYFWYHYLRSRYNEIANLSGSSSMPAISFKTLSNIKAKHPSCPEQHRIADGITSLDDLIAAQTQKLEALMTHKKGLMQQLFPSTEEVEA